MCKQGGKVLSNRHSEIRVSPDDEFVDLYLHCCLCLICLLLGSLLSEEMVHHTNTMESSRFGVADISRNISTFLVYYAVEYTSIPVFFLNLEICLICFLCYVLTCDFPFFQQHFLMSTWELTIMLWNLWYTTTALHCMKKLCSWKPLLN